MEKKIPDFVVCSKCQRRLDVKAYSAFPDKDTPKEIITKKFEPSLPYFSVQCSSCGQYTVFSPSEKDRHDEAS